MSKEEKFRLGRGLAIIGLIVAAISILAMLSGIGPKAGLVCLCVSAAFIVFGKSLEVDNAP